MSHQPKKRSATKAMFVLTLSLAAGMAWAGQVVGTVVNLSGPLLDRKADGTVKILALRSVVEAGDTLMSEKNTYAQIKFIDNSEMTLRPGTTLVVEAFAFDAARPDEDAAAFQLVNGGVRSITGLLGKRNKEKFALKTPAGTIGIRGTTFVAQFVAPGGGAPASSNATPQTSAAGLAGVPPSAGLVPGLYVQVTDGQIIMSNRGGTSNFAAGQFGYVASATTPPVVVPTNPGIKFTPPPVFNSSTGPATGGVGAPASQGAVDCVVR